MPLSVQVQRFDALNEGALKNRMQGSSTTSTGPSSGGRMPLQPRNPNVYGGMSQTSSSTLSGSNEGNSSSSNNKGRIDSYSRRMSSNGSDPGAPEQLQHNSSVITHTGAGGAQAVRGYKRSGSHGSAGRDPPSLAVKAGKSSYHYSNKACETDNSGDIIIEEKRRRLNGEGYTTHRYLRGRMLGKGGFAKVYMCTALDTNKAYAVKVVPKANLVKPRARQKLQAEIKIHRILKHRHVCEYKHFFEDRTNCYILLELCHNQSMNEMIKRRKRITEPEATYYVNQLLEAVEYMHDQRVIHRDLKLGNLFLDRNMNIKVGDLGLATKLETDEEKRKTICGTPNYIAPEVIQGTKETRGHSFEVDIWSMGVILYTVLIGKPPYEAKDVKATYQRIIANQYGFPSHVDVSLEAKDLISLMLQSRPEDRPTIADIRCHPFLNNPAPTTLPSSVLHLVPEWTMTEFGEIEVLSKHVSTGGPADVRKPPSSIQSTRRQPLATRDPNVDDGGRTGNDYKADKGQQFSTNTRTRSVQRGTMAATGGAAPAAPTFDIYDENRETRQGTAPSLRLDELVAKTSLMGIAGSQNGLQSRQQLPTPVSRGTSSSDSDAEVLTKMLHTLTEVLAVAESRKMSYGSSYVRPASRGGPPVWVTRYVDYTSKYGLGFLLNDRSSGVYFNDSTKAVLEAEGDRFTYVERRKVETKEAGVRKTEAVSQEHTLTDYPESLQKKVTLLKHFRNYLVEQQDKAETDSADAAPTPADGAMPYLKKWVRTKHAILFRLSNQTVQIVFYDQTEVLLTPDERYITYVDKKRHRQTFHLSDELVGSNPEMAKRLRYAKEILHQLLVGQQQQQQQQRS